MSLNKMFKIKLTYHYHLKDNQTHVFIKFIKINYLFLILATALKNILKTPYVLAL